MNGSRRMLLASAMTAVALSACGNGGGAAKNQGPPPLAVDVAQAQRQDLATFVTLDGQIAPLQQSTLSTPQSGNVVAVYVNQGQHVGRGEVLAKLDDSALRAQLEQQQALVAQSTATLGGSTLQAPVTSAQASSTIITAQQQLVSARNALLTAQAAYDSALSTYKADKQLLTQGYVAQTSFDQARASYVQALQALNTARETERQAVVGLRAAQSQGTNALPIQQQTIAQNRGALDAARAQVRLLQTEIAQTNIVAPFDGVVTQRLLDPGAFASSNAPVIQVSQIDSVYVNVNVPDEDLGYVHARDAGELHDLERAGPSVRRNGDGGERDADARDALVPRADPRAERRRPAARRDAGERQRAQAVPAGRDRRAANGRLPDRERRERLHRHAHAAAARRPAAGRRRARTADPGDASQDRAGTARIADGHAQRSSEPANPTGNDRNHDASRRFAGQEPGCDRAVLRRRQGSVNHRNPMARALAGVALLALAATSRPAIAQGPGPQVVAQVTPLPIVTPRAASTAAPSGGTSSGNRNQSSSALPGAAGTPAPAAPGAPASPTISGGSTAINAAALPTLAPADQAAPLPYPAYGTPAPVSPPHLAAGVPQVVTLQQAILIAYARSPALAAARAAVAISAAPVELAESAIFPAVTGTVSTTRSHNEAGGNGGSSTGTTTGTTTGTGTGTGTGTTTTTTTSSTTAFVPSRTANGLSISLQQLIFDGGRVAAQIRSARATENASIATYQRQLQTVAYNVATAYYNTLSAQRTTQVDLATVQLDEVQENLVAAQIRAGTEARADLATAQLPTAQARVAVIKAQAAQLTALATFANALGLDAAVDVQPRDDVPPLSATNGTILVTPAFPTPSYDQAIARADLLRPDIASAKQTIVSNQENLRAAKLGNFPTVNLAGDYGTNSSDASGGSFRNSGSIGLTLSIPFYDRGVTRAQTAQAQAQLDQAVANYQSTYQGVQLNVQQAVVNLVSAYAALTQTNAELAQAQTVLRSTQAQYRAGVTTLPLLLNAQVGLTQALTDEVTAAYAVRQAEQTMLFAEGANAAG